MKKIYTFLILLLAGMTNAQLVVTDDTGLSVNDAISGYIYNPDGSFFSIFANDSYNGGAITAQQYSMNLLNMPAGVDLHGDGRIFVNASLPSGTYTINYSLCINNECQDGVLEFSTCTIAVPVLGEIVEATCTEPAYAPLSNLPSGDWTIRVDPYPYYNQDAYNIEGSGSEFSLALPWPGEYQIYVLNDSGCRSDLLIASIDYIYVMDSTTDAQYIDTNGNGLVDTGDHVNILTTLNNMTGCDISNLHVVDGTGNPDMTGANSILPNGSTIWTGVLPLTQQNILDGYVFGWTGISGDSPFGQAYTKAFFQYALPIPTGFRFFAFADLNGNDTQDEDEPLVPFGSFVYERNASDAVSVYSYDGDFILYETDPDATYSVHFSPDSICGAGFTSSQTYENLSITAGEITAHGFPLDNADCSDLGITLYGSAPVPGMTSSLVVYVTNDSLFPHQTTLTVSLDPAVAYLSTEGGSNASFASGVVTVDLDVAALQTGYVVIFYQTPVIPIANLGDVLHFSATISVPENDAIAWNNAAEISKTVVGSYDPNSKEESHNGQIDIDEFNADDRLVYTLNFENTGTADALTVSLVDELSALLDEASVRVLGSTHDYVMYREGNRLEFRFEGINLPPSVVGTSIGHGQVLFSVKMKPGFEVGDVVSNVADIYFDTNPPITTNTVETEFVAELSINDLSKTTLRLYPNPAKTNFQVSGAVIQSMEIFDMTGKMVLSKTENAASGSVDVSGLAGGIYLVKVKTDASVETIRFVKE